MSVIVVISFVTAGPVIYCPQHTHAETFYKQNMQVELLWLRW